jgi:hypothetical protein
MGWVRVKVSSGQILLFFFLPMFKTSTPRVPPFPVVASEELGSGLTRLPGLAQRRLEVGNQGWRVARPLPAHWTVQASLLPNNSEISSCLPGQASTWPYWAVTVTWVERRLARSVIFRPCEWVSSRIGAASARRQKPNLTIVIDRGWVIVHIGLSVAEQ